MNRRGLVVFGCVIFSLWLTLAPRFVFCQSPEYPVSPGGYIVKISADWTHVNACVTDRRSRKVIRNLQKNDFLVFEDGRMQPLKDCLMTDSSFHLLLLLDTSASTAPSMKLIRAASTHFTRQLQPSDRLAVATFNSMLNLRQSFTVDHDRVRAVIEGINSRGNTKLYDAVHTTVRNYLPDVPARKAIVLFTDGADNSIVDPCRGSSTTFSQLLDVVRRSDCVIYPVFLMQGTPLGRDAKIASRAESQMRLLAEETGGRLYTPKGPAELKKVYNEIADDLRSMYTLVYRPPLGSPDTWREVIVTIKDRPDLQVRTRKRYMYNSRQPSPRASVLPESTERSE